MEADGALFSFCRLPQVLVIEQKNEDGTWPRGSTAPKWVNGASPGSCCSDWLKERKVTTQIGCNFPTLYPNTTVDLPKDFTQAVYHCFAKDFYTWSEVTQHKNSLSGQRIWNTFQLPFFGTCKIELCYPFSSFPAPHHLQKFPLSMTLPQTATFAWPFVADISRCLFQFISVLFNWHSHTFSGTAPYFLYSNSWSILYLLKVIWCFQSLCFAKDLAFISHKQS